MPRQSGSKENSFLYDLWTELSGSHALSGGCGDAFYYPINYNGQEIVPIQFLKALLPDPASLGPVPKVNQYWLYFHRSKGWTGETYYIYNVCDHQECYKEVGSQAISYTTAFRPCVGH